VAEVTGLRNNALPYPVYGVPYGVVIPVLDADGDLVSAASTPDSEVSKNGDTFADCTNEITEIATNSGMYYLLLTGTEMTADVVAVIVKTATAGAKTTPIVLYPAKLPTLQSGTVGANAADGTTLQLDSNAVAIDDYYNGCLLVGTLDSNVEARVVADYNGSTKVCTVSPAFVTTPDNNDTYIVYQPWGRQYVDGNTKAFGDIAGSFSSGRPSANVNSIANDAITAAALNADAVTEIQSGLATAAALAVVDDFLDTEVAAILAAVDTEIASLVTAVDALPTNAELATALGTADDATLAAIAAVDAKIDTIDNFVDTEVAAIKAKTDQLVFTKANELDVNIQSVNDVTVNGDGAPGTEWGP
jgi:hypothetical protein